MNRKLKILIWSTSFILVILIPFIFNIRIFQGAAAYIGFPFDWLVFYPNNGYSFQGMGFLLNLLIFYLLIKALILRVNRKKSHPPENNP
ncbi:hypothetical protein [Jeotgalibacillus sp. R-1-5s-1]|uniref:hypothetical protein n=1 Tax=Jeotgalibacillus sp. R-1-5s-1 TaxID=2555897 RepID=UPI00106CF5D6|nr:hypothetical protein [Jeotgalibacillus sp. R-1-5s-1]TFD96626.1 hypothetical protein E2491_10905 [Jeotgalibacillus sp. R-1-5s-1]